MPTTPYMSLLIPTVSVTVGPTYATENNAAFTAIDSHDHTTGKGVAVPTAGIGLDDDLSFASFNATMLRSTRFDMQASPLALVTDIACLYSSGVDLWFNDGSGNKIQMTSGGALNAASIGGIGGDYTTSTATVFYTSATKTFTFWQNTNQNALIDIGSILLRKTTASSAAITIKAGTGLSSGYTMTLPNAVPASQSVVTEDSSGTLGFGFLIDGSNNISGITSIASGPITATGLSTFTDLTTIGNTIFGDAATDSVTFVSTLTSNLIPTDSTYTLGNSSHNFTRLFLDNGATDGGVIFFNSSSTTTNIKCSADGLTLTIGAAFQTFGPFASNAALTQWLSLALVTNIGTTTPTANTLYADLIPKGWANTSTGGSLNAGVNLTVVHTSTGLYTYTFRTALADTNYTVVVTAQTGPVITFCTYGITSTSVFTVRTFTSGGASGDAQHSVIVFGTK